MRPSHWIYTIPLRLRALFRSQEMDQELDEELRFHVEQKTQQYVAAGLDPVEARRRAMLDMYGIECSKEECREMREVTWLHDLAQDLRFGVRMLGKNPGFTFVVALTLALGIGANTAIYSFMDWILMRSLPVHEPESLVVMNWRAKIPLKRTGGQQTKVWHSMSGSIYRDPRTGLSADIFPYPVFDLFRKSETLFSSVFAFCKAGELNLTIKGHSELARSEYVTGDYFRGLGVSAAAGRLLVKDDDRPGAPPVVVVSYGLGQRRFGNAQAAPGQSILINNVPFTVAGVAPPEFFGANPANTPDLYVPMQASVLLVTNHTTSPAEKFSDRNHYWLEIMARLRPGASLAQAQTNLELPFHQWVESTASNDEERANLPELFLTEGARGLDALRRRFSQPLYVLMVLVGLILAIACANVANLLLTRAAARRREIALRLSLGASRLRVVRQLLTESVLLSSLGGLLGLLFAIWGIHLLSLPLADPQANFIPRAELNWNVLGVAAALSLVTGVVFGLAPAVQAARVDVLPAIKELRAGRAPSRAGVSPSRVLVVSQIAMSLLLLFAAGLFLRTLLNLQAVNVGFQRENLLLFRVNARQAGHKGAEMVRFYAELRRRISAIPGIREVSLSNYPLFTAGFSLDEIKIGGVETRGSRLLFVGPGYFTTMQIPLLRGRQIDERDHLGSPEVAVVSELFAKTNFATDDVIGRRITMNDPDARDMEIIGVVKDARYGGVKGDLPPVVYMPYDQGALKFVDEMTYAVRTSGDPLAFANTIRESVRQADGRVPVANMITQAAQIDAAIYQEIAFAKLCTAFALLALLIACVGLYGTVAYSVARRTNEIGIRIALGAQRSAVIFRVLRESFVLAIVGLTISVPAALWGSKLVESFLFDVKPNDAFTVVLAALTLLAAALAASFAPAWKASRIDPMTALRHE